jgi:hypothetical protein
VADVIVHRCTVRLVRAGGWGWGRAPHELVDAALEALPELVEAAVAGLPDGGPDAEAEIVHMSAPVSLAELEERGGEALRVAVADALAAPPRPPAGAVSEPAEVSPAAPVERYDAPYPSSPGAPPAFSLPRELLVRWLRDKVLDSLLELLSPQALEAWHAAALGSDTPVPGATPEVVDPDTVRMVEGLLGTLPEPATREELLRSRLALATAAAASSSDWTAALAITDAARPLDAYSRRAARPDVGEARQRGRDPHARAIREPRQARRGSAPGDGEESGGAALGPAHRVSLSSITALALPFLVAVPLSRLGWFDTVAAALGATGLGDRTPVLAAALAHKVGPAPERGWRRTPEAEHAAAAFAAGEVPAEDFTALAEDALSFASALDATLATAVLAGRGREALVLHRLENGDLLLLDPEGSFPIALTPDTHAIALLLRGGGRPAVHVTAPARTAGVLGALRDARVPTDARRRAGVAPAHLERVDAVFAELHARTAAPLAEDPTLERSLSLASALGLAMLAWMLWGGDGRTDALLALDRLGDLEVRVRIDAERVQVKLPLGRRHADLRDAGLLGTIVGLPWLRGRRVELGA